MTRLLGGRRAGALITAGCLAALVVGVTGTTSAEAATTWVPTHTQALRLTSASLLGPAPATQPLRLTLGLALRNKADLDALVLAEHTPGNAAYETYLTPARFVARYAPTQVQVDAVTTYLRQQGFTNVAVAANRLQVTAAGTVAQAQAAFHTHVARFRQFGHQVFANTAVASVPSSLGRTVVAVLGLSNLGMAPPLQTGDVKTPLTGYQPPEFQKVYDAASLAPATGTAMALIAEGNLSQPLKDLRLAESKEHLPQVSVTVIRTGPASPDTAGNDEWDLDMQSSTGMARSVKHLYVYDATSLTNADLARAINRFVSDDLAKAGSASLGECDALPFADGSMLVDDAALEEAAAQGQTFFASSGDTGSSCAVLPTNGVPGSGVPDTEYPASSTWTTGVGGTTLVTDSADHYTNEIAWNAGGGGVSALEYPGWWTANADPLYPAGARGVPDIAMDADLTTGALIYVDGTQELIGGTSLSSPLALGAWARIESAHANHLGNASLVLYRLYNKVNTSPTARNAVPGFHDVIAGVNGTYTATPGWDYTTGIGSFDVTALSKRLH